MTDLLKASSVSALVCLLMACSREDPAALRKRVAHETQLPLPHGASVVQFSEMGALIDPAWAAKVEIPQASLASFQASLEAKPASPFLGSPRFSDTLPWWRPRKPARVREYIEWETSALVTVIMSTESGHTFAYIDHAVVDL